MSPLWPIISEVKKFWSQALVLVEHPQPLLRQCLSQKLQRTTRESPPQWRLQWRQRPERRRKVGEQPCYGFLLVEMRSLHLFVQLVPEWHWTRKQVRGCSALRLPLRHSSNRFKLNLDDLAIMHLGPNVFAQQSQI